MLLSTLIGLLTILISCAMLLHEQSNVEAATALIHDLPLSLVTGIGVLICGLAIVLGHNVWSGGVLPVVITIYGWSLLIRGVLLLCLSSDARASIFEMLHLKDLFLFYVTINLSLGVYLTYGGFRVCLAPSGSEWDATLVEVEPASQETRLHERQARLISPLKPPSGTRARTHKPGSVVRGSLNVRFVLKATELLRHRELARRAKTFRKPRWHRRFPLLPTSDISE